MVPDEVVTSPRAAFRNRDFRLYQFVRLFSIVAFEMQSVAVGWQIYEITHRAIDLGYVGLAQFLPGVLLFLVAGHAADRFDRRHLLLVCNSAYAGCSILLLLNAHVGRHGVATIYVIITMLGVVWHIMDDDEARDIIGRLMERTAPGSYLAIAHPTIEITGEQMLEAIRQWNQFGKPPGIHRTPQQIENLFQGLELIEPGIVSCPRWRPEATPFGEPDEMDQFGGVARKP